MAATGGPTALCAGRWHGPTRRAAPAHAPTEGLRARFGLGAYAPLAPAARLVRGECPHLGREHQRHLATRARPRVGPGADADPIPPCGTARLVPPPSRSPPAPAATLPPRWARPSSSPRS